MAKAKTNVPATNDMRLEDLVGFLLRRAWNSFSIRFGESLGDQKIARGLFGTLAVIHDTPGISQSEVARRLRIQRANMVPMISDLVRRGWVERKAAAADRRIYSLTLTNEGRTVYREAWTSISKGEQELLGALTPIEQQMLIALLHKLDTAET